jgi:hypothetical protein
MAGEKAMQEVPKITNTDLDIRHFIYTTFAETARPPATREIAEFISLSIDEIEGSLDRLAQAHHIALAPGTHTIWMAHPFSGLPTNYIAKVEGKKYWGN